MAVRDLLVVVPTRGRPQNMRRLIESLHATAQGDTRLMMGVDADDPCLPQYGEMVEGNVGIDVNRKGLKGVVALMNWLAVPEVDNYKAIGTVGDDNVFQTPGWDVKVTESLSETNLNLFCFGDDRYPRERGSLCCHIFMRSEVIAKLGYMGPPIISHMYVDPVWMAWGKATSIEFLGDVQIPHLHYTLGHPNDVVYMDSLAMTGPDLIATNTYCHSGDLNADIAKLGGRPYSPEELATFKRDLNIPCGICANT